MFSFEEKKGQLEKDKIRTKLYCQQIQIDLFRIDL